MSRLSPINSKFANVSLQIRATTNSLYQNAPTKSTSLTTTLISSTNLYTFNCSYFRECMQCLSDQLGGSCVWCAKNSKCVFAKSSSSSFQQTYLSIDGGGNNKKMNNDFESECPNEIEFYRRASNSRVDSMCTSLQWVQSSAVRRPSIFSVAATTQQANTSWNEKRIEIPYSAESSLAQTMNGLNRLAIKNPHRNYQLNFKCVFSKQKSVSAEELHGPASSSYFEWLPDNSVSSQTPNLYPFDCKYAPYNDAKQLSADLALQTVYLSVWWSSQPQATGYQAKSLDGWNQVKIRSDNLDQGNFYHFF